MLLVFVYSGHIMHLEVDVSEHYLSKVLGILFRIMYDTLLILDENGMQWD